MAITIGTYICLNLCHLWEHETFVSFIEHARLFHLVIIVHDITY